MSSNLVILPFGRGEIPLAIDEDIMVGSGVQCDPPHQKSKGRASSASSPNAPNAASSPVKSPFRNMASVKKMV